MKEFKIFANGNAFTTTTGNNINDVIAKYRKIFKSYGFKSVKISAVEI